MVFTMDSSACRRSWGLTCSEEERFQNTPVTSSWIWGGGKCLMGGENEGLMGREEGYGRGGEGMV